MSVINPTPDEHLAAKSWVEEYTPMYAKIDNSTRRALADLLAKQRLKLTQAAVTPTIEQLARRPEWVKCALTGMFDGPDRQIQETWCGRTAKKEGLSHLPFCFVDATHATLNAKNGGRLVLCQDCRMAIVAALTTQADDATPKNWTESGGTDG